MNLRNVRDILNAEVLWGEELLDEMEVEYAFASDLMSDVLAFATPGSFLLTGLTNVQIVRTASMMDMPGVVFVRGKRPGSEALSLAKNMKIPLLLSCKSMFESCGLLFVAGILPCKILQRRS
ncbi:MAG: hypothetical protein PWP50_453 [Synergistaceae bacterium]|nr:hypothetical protein [Synergistaceae bacterium]